MEKGTQLPYPIQESCAMLVGSPGPYCCHGTSSIMKHRCSRYNVLYWTVEPKAPTLRSPSIKTGGGNVLQASLVH